MADTKITVMSYRTLLQLLVMVSVAVGAVVLVSPACGATPVAASTLPEGPGKAVLLQICTQCHSIEQVISRHRTEEEWETVITRMTTEGAVVTDTQFQAILAYLAMNFGKPDVSSPSPAAPGQ